MTELILGFLAYIGAIAAAAIGISAAGRHLALRRLEREPDEPASLAPFLTWLLAAFVAGILVAFLAQRLVQS